MKLNWFKKDTFVLVHTIEIPVSSYMDGKETDARGVLHFYLFEDKDGKRKTDHIWQLRGVEEKHKVSHLKDYGTIIYPWLNGKNFKDIPTYWDTVKEQRADDIKRMYKRYFK